MASSPSLKRPVSRSVPRSNRTTVLGPPDSVGPRNGSDAVDAAREAIRRSWDWARSDEVRSALRAFATDAIKGGWRVVRSIRRPTREGVIDFFTHQLLVNVVGWMAGFITAYVVTQLFEVRGARNLWGLAASGDRSLVGADDYRLIMTITGFTVGLLTMLFVRHFLMRWIAETRTLRAERRGITRFEPKDRPASAVPPTGRFYGHETEHD
jgi:hypothetical protein